MSLGKMGLRALLYIGCSLVAFGFESAHAYDFSNLSVDLGVSFSRGNGYANPVYGQGGNFGQLGSVCGGGYQQPPQILIPPQPSPCGGGCGGCSACSSCGNFSPCGGGGCASNFQPQPFLMPQPFLPPRPPIMLPPALPPLPPPAPLLPPAFAQQNQLWGPGNGCYPAPRPVGPTFGPNCVPCQIGIQPQPILPVAGGPLINGGAGVEFVRVGGINEWEKNDTAAILAVEASSFSNDRTNVYPYGGSRYIATPISNTSFSAYGNLNTGLIERPHVGP